MKLKKKLIKKIKTKFNIKLNEIKYPGKNQMKLNA